MTRNAYQILLEGASAEIVEKKSRFIATIRPVMTEEEASAFIEKMKKQYWDARHNCSAFVVGENNCITRCSDDGEPSGTAGRPMLEVLLGSGIRNVCVVVTRYFGGILLGTGGLVRAYTGTAKAALEAAGLCQVREMDILKIKMDYSCYGKLQNLAGEGAFQIRDAVFEDMVILNLAAEPERLGEVRGIVSNLTAGQGIELGIARELVHIPELSKTE